MKRIGASILLILFTLQIAYSGLVAVWYYANQQYIATILCVNKDKKEMKCNGKCAMNKKLSQAENSQSEQAPLTTKKPTEASPFLLVQSHEFNPNLALVLSYEPMQAGKYKFIHYQDIFHPPSISFS